MGGRLQGYAADVLNLLRKPTVTARDLDEGLSGLGLDGTQDVIVHASLRAFGTVEGGAPALVDALARRCRTVVAPAFTYDTLLTRPTATPRSSFHRLSHVSRDIGRVPQDLVERPEALRSFHPTLSFIALGAQAAPITAAQTLDSPYQPVGALYDLDGYVLLMGVDFGSNTTIHYGEHVAGVPNLTRYVPLEGQVLPTAFPNCSADFDNLLPWLHGRDRRVTVGSALLRLYRVRDLVDTTVRFLQHDPEGLLCTYRGCRCQEVRALVRERGLTPRRHTVTAG